MTAVVVDGSRGKEYRPPIPEELSAAEEAASHVEEVFKDIPFGLPTEPLPTKEALGFRVPLYGFNKWYKLFTPRQLVALGTFVKHTRAARGAIRAEGYPPEWVEALSAYLAIGVDKLVDRQSALCRWDQGYTKVNSTFTRFALPMLWDFCEGNPLSDTTGNYLSCVEWVAECSDHASNAAQGKPTPITLARSAARSLDGRRFDLVVTDPPYYDAIPYSDLMDFFYVWLRRTLHGFSPQIDTAFQGTLAPKWDHAEGDGELIDDSSRFGGDAQRSKAAYEDGIFRAFQSCHGALDGEGRMVIVFANKQPDAWETIVSSMIRAGFVVDGSWPIQTEMGNRSRAHGSAALASSVWLVCRKRPETAKPGWDNQVLEDMHTRIHERLRDFWDAGIRGPDFVWAATGPALEAYSKHPVVKKADEPNAIMCVSEFLRHVRRMVVDYAVGRLLSRNGDGQRAEGLDDQTIYYLLHRSYFGLEEAQVGACILYAQSCNLADRDLVDRYDLLAYGKSRAALEAEEDEGEEGDVVEEETPTSGSTVKLKRWEQRQRKDLGVNTGGRVAPLIDQVHRIMHLWRAGDVQKVDSYLEDQGLRRNPLFPRLLQALIELAGKNNQPEERSLLETIMNHVTARGVHPQMRLITPEE